VFTAGVRQPRDLVAAGRPHRTAIVRTRALGEVSRLALLRRDREDLAAGFEGGAHARRRQHRASDQTSDLLELRSRPWEVADDLDAEPTHLLRRHVEEVKI